MTAPIIVVGHRNPDNDAICAAVGYAYLKNELAKREAARTGEEQRVYVPRRLGPLPAETAWVLAENGFAEPELLDNVYMRVADAMIADPPSVGEGASLREAALMLREQGGRSLVVTGEDGSYRGLLAAQALARRVLAATADAESAADGLGAALEGSVSECLESEVMKLAAGDLLKDVLEDLLASDLREAVVLDEDGRCIGMLTRESVEKPARQDVVLVDHNETHQAVPGLEEANIVEVLDHHRIGNVSTANPIQFINLPLGSTATIVALEFERLGIELPAALAAVLLSAILTDTVVLKSPTATETDRQQVERLAGIVGVDPTEFGVRVFQCRGGEKDMPVEELVGADSKEFQAGDAKVLIAQRETVDLAGVLAREDEIRAYMSKLCADNGYEFALLMATDIIAEGSQFICEGNCRTVERVFGITCQRGGTWMPGVLSRKKQVAAPLLGA